MEPRERVVWDVSHGLKVPNEMPLEIQSGGSLGDRMYEPIFSLIMGGI